MRLIEFEGQIKSITQWEEVFGIDERIIHWRLKKGWAIKDAITKPTRRMPRRLPQSIRKQKQTVRLKRKNKNKKHGGNTGIDTQV